MNDPVMIKLFLLEMSFILGILVGIIITYKYGDK